MFRLLSLFLLRAFGCGWIRFAQASRFFNPNRPFFADTGLQYVDLGLSKVDGLPLALGDFNSDKFTDMFVLNTAQSQLDLYIWNHDLYRFDIKPAARILTNDNNMVIVNAVPGDYNYDGKLDILVMMQDISSGSSNTLSLKVYFGDGNQGFLDSKGVSIPSSTIIQPTILDFTGNMKPDLLGYPSDKPSQLHLWKNNFDPSVNSTSSFELIPVEKLLQNGKMCSISRPHSNAFVDLNGDCLADLFLTCQDENSSSNTATSFQIWTNNKENGFELAIEGKLPSGTGQVSFADIDRDSTVDMVFPVCVQNKCYIHVVYNKQKPLCSAKKKAVGESCRLPEELCTSDPDFKFDFSLDSGGHTVLDLTTASNAENTAMFKLMVTDSLRGDFPIPIRIGDYNLDGFPDLLATVIKDGQSKLMVFQSLPCDNKVCTSEETKASRRTFVDDFQSSSMSELSDVVLGTFMDFDEAGDFDFVLIQKKAVGQQTGLAITFLHNNYYYDAFFIKTVALNGVCPGWCPTGERFPIPKPYGVNYVGASFKYTVIDTSGKKQAGQVSQLTQTSYAPLQSPYCLFGLGRTNNYVEELYAGVSRHQTQHYSSWPGMIPNSQLIIIPYQESTVTDPSTWTIELFINPSDYAPWVFLGVTGSMLLLGGIVGMLHWMEMREDEIERKKALHIINFDAL